MLKIDAFKKMNGSRVSRKEEATTQLFAALHPAQGKNLISAFS